MYRSWCKRTLDLCLSTLAILVLAPVYLLFALLVRLLLGSPVLFRQQRPGQFGRPFILYKYRTMTNALDSSDKLLPDACRLTHFGKFLRRSSLDELPELFNVIRGEMSLVGPRPLLVRYTPYFTDAERERFNVLPGITGLAQVTGRNDMSWDSRISADLEYVKRYSLKLDIKILVLTAYAVFSRRGMQVDPGSTMLDFDEERRQHQTSTLL
jgi:lipopolysaccharide/colanic/teichoic acid biosynthesis glycosyltransferase